MVAVVDNDKIALEWSEKSKVIKISLRTSRDKYRCISFHFIRFLYFINMLCLDRLNAGNTNRSLFSLAVGCADSLVADWYNLKVRHPPPARARDGGKLTQPMMCVRRPR